MGEGKRNLAESKSHTGTYQMFTKVWKIVPRAICVYKFKECATRALSPFFNRFYSLSSFLNLKKNISVF